ncbi:hypothetical protein B842_03430 [Corynebacterium humireducens NBRC 106098 = DSM 45392]|uniref:Uncharacterized protein n=1 Tax=Corynebacterium humireducens NBRC 106098 = DSM 45392 TaxID=1223515 RepID=A0A0B5DA13_9CORY|nr:hypothetical protein [Corynebacterium humireducens]AJE32539.1 hypothetical protein B842_03430 [Corynebacterium humireducens NBRC 106098 = DSM 45392]
MTTTLTVGLITLTLFTTISLRLLAAEILRLNSHLEHTHAVAHAALAALELHLQGKDVEILHLPLRDTPEEE